MIHLGETFMKFKAAATFLMILGTAITAVSGVARADLSSPPYGATPNPDNLDALSRLNRILERSSYDGLTPSGFPCHVTVARETQGIGLPGHVNPLWALRFSVIEPNRGVPPIQSVNGQIVYPVWVDVGSFSLGQFSPPDTVVAAEATESRYTLKVYSKPADLPGVRFLDSTTTTLVFTADPQTGQLNRIAGEMVYYNGASDRTTTGNFSCGR